MRILEAVRLADKTTFNIGGFARYYAEITSLEELTEALRFAHEHNLPWFIFAGGSNVLFGDAGFNGLIIRMCMTEVTWHGTKITAAAGVNLSELIKASAERDLTLWEQMYGIPGTIGGAVRGNAGAFGVEMEHVVECVHALNADTGELREFAAPECAFAYRNSFFKQNPKWIILSATLKLKEAELGATPLALCYNTLEEREKRHLQTAHCAGSFFKNPIGTSEVVAQFELEKQTESKGGKVPAGWLIEKCALKGAQVGGACCSAQHPNYITNTGGASAEDVKQLRDLVQERVHTTFGITLEPEVTIVE